MLVLFHVLIALLSVAFTTYLFFAPSKQKFYVSYALIAGTLISGTFLAIRAPAHLTQTCITGLFYIGFVSIILAAAQYRLAVVRKRSR